MQTFNMAYGFNGPVGSWDTTGGTSFKSTFQNAIVFNNSLTNWNVAKAVSLSYMLKNAEQFEQELSASKSWSCPSEGQNRLGQARYIRVENNFDSHNLRLAEVQAFDIDGILISAVGATMTPTKENPSGSGGDCIDGDRTTQCSVSNIDWLGNDTNDGKLPHLWLMIDYGAAGVHIKKIVVTPSRLFENRIDKGVIAITADANADSVLWTSAFSSPAITADKGKPTCRLAG
jgi:hypothetical protein